MESFIVMLGQSDIGSTPILAAGIFSLVFIAKMRDKEAKKSVVLFARFVAIGLIVLSVALGPVSYFISYVNLFNSTKEVSQFVKEEATVEIGKSYDIYYFMNDVENLNYLASLEFVSDTSKTIGYHETSWDSSWYTIEDGNKITFDSIPENLDNVEAPEIHIRIYWEGPSDARYSDIYTHVKIKLCEEI